MVVFADNQILGIKNLFAARDVPMERSFMTTSDLSHYQRNVPTEQKQCFLVP